VSGPDITVTASEPGMAEITGITAAALGDLAASLGIPVHELTSRSGSLEDAYLALTGDSVEYKTKEIA
jgi:ABC-2 type transport system ATP-binding protein